MSDKESMGSILKIEPIFSSNSRAWKTSYSKFEPEQKRHAAAAVALELIKADISAPSNRSGTDLGYHIESLPKYIELITKALDGGE